MTGPVRFDPTATECPRIDSGTKMVLRVHPESDATVAVVWLCEPIRLFRVRGAGGAAAAAGLPLPGAERASTPHAEEPIGRGPPSPAGDEGAA